MCVIGRAEVVFRLQAACPASVVPCLRLGKGLLGCVEGLAHVRPCIDVQMWNVSDRGHGLCMDPPCAASSGC